MKIGVGIVGTGGIFLDYNTNAVNMRGYQWVLGVFILK